MRSAPLGLVLVAACVPTESLTLPPIPEGHGALLLIAPEELPIGAIALASAKDTPLTLPRHAHLELLILEHPLDAFELAEGKIELLNDAGRALPYAITVHALEITPDAISGWNEVDAIGAVFSGARLPPFDLEACASRGRCIAGAKAEEHLACIECAPYDGPRSPEPPDLVGTGCLGGWSLAPDDPPRCVPPPLPLFDGGCDSGLAQRYSESACKPLGGRPCPLGQYADDLPLDAIRAANDAELAQAIANAPSTATIALAKTSYGPLANLRSGLTIRGACASGTTLGSVTTHGEVTLMDLSIESTTVAVSALAGSRMTLLRTDASGGESAADVRAGTLLLRDARARSGQFGCLRAADGALLGIDGSTIESCAHVGISAVSATVSISRSIIANITSNEDGFAAGIDAGGGSLSVRDVLIEGVVIGAQVIFGEAAFVEGLTVREARMRAPMGSSTGVHIFEGRATLRALHVAGADLSALTIGRGSRVVAEQLMFEDVARMPGGDEAFAIGVLGTTSISASRVVIEQVYRRAILVAGDENVGGGDPSASFTDLSINHVSAPAAPIDAAAIATILGTVRIKRARIDDSAQHAILAESTFSADSIDIHGAGLDGIHAVRTNVSLSSVAISGVREVSLSFKDMHGGSVRELSITGGVAPAMRTGGLRFDDTSELAISGLRIADVRGPAIIADPGNNEDRCLGCVSLARTIVEHSDVGLQLNDPLLPLAELLTDVHFIENTATIVRGAQ